MSINISQKLLVRLGNIYPESRPYFETSVGLPSEDFTVLGNKSISNILNPDFDSYNTHHRFIVQELYGNKLPKSFSELYLDSIELAHSKKQNIEELQTTFKELIPYVSKKTHGGEEKLSWLKKGITTCIESQGDINSLLKSYLYLYESFKDNRLFNKHRKLYSRSLMSLPKNSTAVEYLNAHYSIYRQPPQDLLEDIKELSGSTILEGYKYLSKLSGVKIDLPSSSLKAYVGFVREMIAEGYNSAAIYNFSKGYIRILNQQSKDGTQKKEKQLEEYYPRCKKFIDTCKERKIPLEYVGEIFSNTSISLDVYMVLDPIQALLERGITDSDAHRNLNRAFLSRQHKNPSEEIKNTMQKMVNVFLLAEDNGVSMTHAASLFDHNKISHVEECVKVFKELIDLAGIHQTAELTNNLKVTYGGSLNDHKENLQSVKDLLIFCNEKNLDKKKYLSSLLEIKKPLVALNLAKLLLDSSSSGKCSQKALDRVCNRILEFSKFSSNERANAFIASCKELIDFSTANHVPEEGYLEYLNTQNPSFFVSFKKMHQRLDEEGYTDKKYHDLVEIKLNASQGERPKNKNQFRSVLDIDKVVYYETNLFENLRFYTENKNKFESIPFLDRINKISSAMSSESFQALCRTYNFNPETLNKITIPDEDKLIVLDGIEKATLFNQAVGLVPTILQSGESSSRKISVLKNIETIEDFNLFVELIDALEKGDSILNFDYIISNASYPAYVSSIKNIPKEKRSKALREMAVHVAISVLAKSNDKEARIKARRFIQLNATSDHVPYPQELPNGSIHPQAKRVYNQALITYRRAFDIYHGYSALSYDARRTKFDKLPMLHRFGADVADVCKFIKTEGNDVYPGRAVFISGINLDNIFAKDSKAEEKSLNPFHDHISAMPWMADEFLDLPLTDFILGRGFISVTCHNGDKYKLQDKNYSYVIFNDHFGDNEVQSVILVPSSILYEAIQGTLYDPALPSDENIKTINSTSLTFSELKNRCKELEANLLNIGWGSNIGGGLVNAYPPKSLPYHGWEVYRDSHTKDAYGHVHKSHIDGGFAWRMNERIDALLQPLRKADTEVYKFTRSSQNLFDMFRLSLSMYHKGFTIGENPVFNYEEEIPEEINEEELLEEIDEIEFGEGSDVFGDSTLRMYAECYKWNQSGNEQNIEDRNYYPVLVITDTLNYWSKPKTEVYLDTFDMSLHAGENTFDLSRPFLAKSRNTWFKEVMEKVLETSKDLRLYDRRDLGIL